MLVPKSYSLSKEDNKRQCYRPSIEDSRNSFFLCGETPADIETKLLKIKEKKQPIQPLVLIEGSILNIKNVFLYFDEVRYKFFFTIRSHKHLFQNFSCIPFRISVTFTPHVGFYSKIFI